MTYSAANRKDVRRLEKQARLDEASRQETITTLMATMAGRQWVYDRLTAGHIFSSSFSLDPLQMAFREGERNAGLQLLNDVMATSPDSYVIMMREANVRHSSTNSGTAGGEHARGEDFDGGDQAGDEPDTADAA